MSGRDFRSKKFVLESFLQFVQKYVSIESMHIGTLGGEGLEANIWMQAGLPQRQGWLVEWDQERQRQLRRAQLSGWFYLCNSLALLPQALGRQIGGRGLDAFHFDLCGFLRTSFDHIRPVLPHLIKKERGRCLALSTVDKHSSPYTSDHEKFFDRACATLGLCDTRFLVRELQRQQRKVPHSRRPQNHGKNDGQPSADIANPASCAQREFGTFADILLLLTTRKPLYLVDAIDRYVYVSRWAGSSWRMRSYFFHMSEQVAATKAEVAHQLMETWIASPLRYINAEGKVSRIRVSGYRQIAKVQIKEDEVPHPPSVTIAQENQPKETQALGFVAQMLGGNALAEYQALVAKAAKFETLQKRMSQIAEMIISYNKLPVDVTESAPTEEQIPIAGALGTVAAPQGPRTVVRSEHKRVPLTKRQIVMRLIEARAAGADTYEKAQADIGPEVGMTKNYKGRLGTMFARSMGKYRPVFLFGMAKEMTEEGMKETLSLLAPWYSKIDGKPVTVTQLQEEIARAPREISARMQKQFKKRAGR